MKLKTKALYLFIILVSSIIGQELPESFSNYKLKEGLCGIQLYFAPSINVEDVKVENNKTGKLKDGIEFKIRNITCQAICFYDPIETPGLTISFEKEGKKFDYDIEGETIYISSTGNFYSDTKGGYLFNFRKKFSLGNNGIKEVVQPFYSVDQTCTVVRNLKLISEKCDTTKVLAVIPAGMEVQILLAEHPDFAEVCNGGRNYLVKTSFGLVGWINTSTKHAVYDKEKPQIDCFVDYGP